MSTNTAWSHAEVEAVVADYLDMFVQELSGLPYNKSEHRRILQEKLQNRSEGAIERKHQNISAILIELGCPYISGYKPLSNYQRILFDIVLNQLEQNSRFDLSVINEVERPAAILPNPNFEIVIESPPALTFVAEHQAQYQIPTVGVKRDYLDREARNHSLGAAGEVFVLAYERHRLKTTGHFLLSDQVEHVSKTKGDGLGFDILSFDNDGRERFIEVKTTAFGKETPFFYYPK